MTNIYGLDHVKNDQNKRMEKQLGGKNQNNHKKTPHQSSSQNPCCFQITQFTADDYTLQQVQMAEFHRVLFISGRTKSDNPRLQSFCNMLYYFFCPGPRCMFFTIFVILANFSVFIASLALGFNQSASSLLAVKAVTLLVMGSNTYPLVYLGQAWRLITAMFLHADFSHILGNMFITLIFLPKLEYTSGIIKVFFIYILSGIAGNIFSAVFGSLALVKIGASTAVYGILGAIIGYTIINFKGLDIVGRVMKFYVVAITVVMFISVLILSFIGGSNVDNMGHVGGFLGGLWLSALNNTIANNCYEIFMRSVFGVLLVTQFLVTFLVFYLSEPQPF